MNSIKIAVFDIDGTLLGRFKDLIEESSVSAIHQLKEKGIQVLVATGRSFYFIKPHVRKVLDCDYYVSINGSCLLNHEGKVIVRHDIPSTIVDEVLALCESHDLALALKTSKEMVVLRDYPGFAKHYGQGFDIHNLMIDDTQAQDFHKKTEAAMGLFIIGEVNKIQVNLKAIPELRVEVLGDRSLDIFLAPVNKTTGIDEVLKLANLSWENVIAFGDANNDTEMIEKAQIGVAMGNATDALKEKASYVTLACDEGGIEAALKHYHLID